MIVRQKGEDVTDKPKKIWFEAKEYGYGAGLPASWEGWVVFIGFFILITAGFFLPPIEMRMELYLPFVFVLTVVFVAIAVRKSPEFRWRWGYDDLEQMSNRQAAAKRRKEKKDKSNQKVDNISKGSNTSL
ncbi:MAG: hypothetical protein HN341_10850 [Verrucomicrobia bacterium]|nr:hypothetical protein [Verrucomicrobiota bacterium]